MTHLILSRYNMRKDFFGVVEDRNDPLQIGRVRVRVHGIHTDNKQHISTPDLPWAQVLLPTTSAALSGMGTQHGLIEGSTVYGFFRDGDSCQDPVVVAASAGYPASGYFETSTDELLTRSPDKGFNDPRKLTLESYNGTPDGPNPSHDSRRTHGLTLAMDTAPKGPETIDIKYDATGSTITEYEVKEEDLPWYPLYTDESDLSSFARGSILDKNINESLQENITGGEMQIPDSPAAPVYPFNKVTQTESGHVFEVDDTMGAERISTYHRSGTFQEIHPDGSIVHRIVNDNNQVVCKDNKLYIAGNYDVIVEKGNVTINVNTGDVNMTVAQGNVTSTVTKGNFTGTIGGTTDVTSAGKITITNTGGGGEDEDGNTNAGIELKATKIQMTGALHVTGAQTNNSTIVAEGTITDSGATLATHKHEVKKVRTGTSTITSEKPK